jgi:hypothetical protein
MSTNVSGIVKASLTLVETATESRILGRPAGVE